MSFLKKLGQILNTAQATASVFAPIITMATANNPKAAQIAGQVTDGIAVMMNAVVLTEQLGQAMKVPGADKAKAVGPVVFQVLATSSLVAGHTMRDPEGARLAADRMAGNLADFLNCYSEDKLVVTPSIK